jgi:hypothetical protein
VTDLELKSLLFGKKPEQDIAAPVFKALNESEKAVYGMLN